MRCFVLLLLACAAGLPAWAVGTTRSEPATPASAELVATLRGKYLVERVMLCGDCHTPHDARGRPVPGKLLQGGPVALRPARPLRSAERAPAIAGLPNYTDDQMLSFLQTGRRPDGSTPLPPMPAYRLSSADAQAVVAYLKSLR